MKLIFMWMNQAYAVDYIPTMSDTTNLPFFPELATIEKIILFAIFLILLIPLFKTHKDKKFEKFSFKILKISSAACALLIAIHFYRLVSGG